MSVKSLDGNINDDENLENDTLLDSYGKRCDCSANKDNNRLISSTTEANEVKINRRRQFGNQDEHDYFKLPAFLIFFFPALGGFLFGYDIGGTSAVIAQLQSNVYSGITWGNQIAESSVIQGLITSSTMFGAVVGSMTCFAIADKIGRKKSLIIASIIFFTGSSVEFLSGNSKFSYEVGCSSLVFGRLIYGYACGFAMHGAPAYIGQVLFFT